MSQPKTVVSVEQMSSKKIVKISQKKQMIIKKTFPTDEFWCFSEISSSTTLQHSGNYQQNFKLNLKKA